MNVEIRRSARRKRTVAAYQRGDTLIVLMPAHLSADEERAWVQRMQERVRRRAGTALQAVGDEELHQRALRLSARYLRGRARPSSVRWVGNQQRRWGSATPATRTIRLSDQLRGMPSWVIDYVLVHELAHLLVSGHGRDFWALVAAYEQTERARGYLEGFAAATGQSRPVDGEDDEDSDPAPGGQDADIGEVADPRG